MRTHFLVLLLIPLLASCATGPHRTDSKRLHDVLGRIAEGDRSDQDIDELVVEIGGWFLGTPYAEKTLEVPGPEQLVVNLEGLDCTTYLETVVALARLARKGSHSAGEYRRELTLIRYIDGRLDGFPSRLHYFSDWMADNADKGVLEDITATIGGVPYANRPSFMSSRPDLYRQLVNPAYIDAMKAREALIASRTYHYIPTDRLRALEHRIRPGDVIAITASRADLDVVHVGFAVRRGGRVHLLQASSLSGKVEVADRPLVDELVADPSTSGIMVARLRWR